PDREDQVMREAHRSLLYSVPAWLRWLPDVCGIPSRMPEIDGRAIAANAIGVCGRAAPAARYAYRARTAVLQARQVAWAGLVNGACLEQPHGCCDHEAREEDHQRCQCVTIPHG